MDELVKEIFIFIAGVGVGMSFLSRWTLKSLKTHDLTLIDGKDTWVERESASIAHNESANPTVCLRCNNKGYYLIGADEIRCESCHPLSSSPF